MNAFSDGLSSPRGSSSHQSANHSQGAHAASKQAKWPKFASSALRRLIVEELTKRGVDGTVFTPSSALQVAEAASGLLRFVGEKTRTHPDPEREAESCKLLQTPRGRQELASQKTVTALCFKDFADMVPAYVAAQAELWADRYDPPEAKVLTERLVSRIRAFTRLALDRAWISDFSVEEIRNPLSTRVDWTAVPFYAEWRAHQANRMQEGTRTRSTFVNMASHVHGFLELALRRTGAPLNAQAELGCWAKLKGGVASNLPRSGRHSTVTEIVCRELPELFKLFEKGLEKRPASTQVAAKSAVRSLLSVYARQAPAAFLPQALKEFGIGYQPSLPILIAWSRAASDEPQSQRVYRSLVRKLIRSVARSENIEVHLPSELKALVQAKKAAKHGPVRASAFDSATLKTVTASLLLRMDKHLETFVRGIEKNKEISKARKADIVGATRRFALWVRNEGMAAVSDVTLALFAASPASSGEPAPVRAPRLKGKIQKRIPNKPASSPIASKKVQQAHSDRGMSGKEKTGSRAPREKILEPQRQATNHDTGKQNAAVPASERKGYTFALEALEQKTVRPLQKTDALARAKELDTIEAIVRDHGSEVSLADLSLAALGGYFPNIAKLQLVIERRTHTLSLSEETNHKLRDYCETALTSPLGTSWKRDEGEALLFPGNDGKALFGLQCSERSRRNSPKLMNLQFRAMQMLLGRSILSSTGTVVRPVTFLDLANIAPKDLSVAEGRVLIRQASSAKQVGVVKLKTEDAHLMRDLVQGLRVSGSGSSWDSMGDRARLFMSADGDEILPDDLM